MSVAVAGIAVLTSGCSLWGWGFPTTVGDGGAAFRLAPVRIGTSADWVQVSDSKANVCAIQKDGALYCWGENSDGELGDGDETPQEALNPVRVGTGTWRAVANGQMHVCGIQTDGSLWCWASSTYGQVGVGEINTRKLTPVQVGTAAWKSIATGSYHTCGIRADDSLWCWGDNEAGQVGDGAAQFQSTPFRVDTAAWSSVTAGADHTCGIRSDHSLWCWGGNRRGQLGDGTRSGRSVPVQVGAARWNTASAGLSRTCGIHTNATLWCWGDNTDDLLGTGTPFAVRLRPGRVGTATDWSAISTSWYHSCGIRTRAADRNTLWCWGGNPSGQLGDGTTDPATAPEQIGEPDNWFAVSVGPNGTHALLGPQT